MKNKNWLAVSFCGYFILLVAFIWDFESQFFLLGMVLAFAYPLKQMIPFRVSFVAWGWFAVVMCLLIVVIPNERVGWVQKWLQTQMPLSRVMTGVGFGPGEKLGSLDQNFESKDEIVLKLIGENVPLYWAGSRSHTYANGLWSQNEWAWKEPFQHGSPVRIVPKKISVYWQDRTGKGFVPPATLALESSHDGFSVWVNSTVSENLFVTHRQGSLPLALDLGVPVELKSALSQIIVQNCRVDSVLNPKKKAHTVFGCVTRYLSIGFVYDLSPKMNEKEPLLGFLERKRGYCSYFASAMVLLMRQSGIPARLVEGYAFPEKVGDSQWVLRNSNAHAWVEFWDGENWISVDPTPTPTIYEGSKSISFKGLFAVLASVAGVVLVYWLGVLVRKRMFTTRPKEVLMSVEVELHKMGISKESWEPVTVLIQKIDAHSSRSKLEEIRKILLEYRSRRYS